MEIETIIVPLSEGGEDEEDMDEIANLPPIHLPHRTPSVSPLLYTVQYVCVLIVCICTCTPYTVGPHYSEPLKCGHLILTNGVQIAFPYILTPKIQTHSYSVKWTKICEQKSVYEIEQLNRKNSIT